MKYSILILGIGMIIHLFFLLLFAIIPMILPLSVFTLFSVLKSASFMSTQNEYSEQMLSSNLDELTAKTIQVRQTEQTEKLEINALAWVFLVPDQKGVAEIIRKTPSDSSTLAGLGGAGPAGVTKKMDIQKKAETADEDPFLQEWREKQGSGYSVVSIQKQSKRFLGLRHAGLRRERLRPRNDNKPPSPNENVENNIKDHKDDHKPEVNPPAVASIIEDGKEKPAVLLNMDLTNGGYLSYTTVEGTLSVEEGNWIQSFYEVSFYDRVGEGGIDDESSTVIASQEIRDPSRQFVLRIPAESSGILVAKGYALEDVEKKNPIYLGSYEKKPFVISREGARNLNIALFPRDEYLSKYLTTFVGKIYNEYEGKNSTQCVSQADVWVLELNQRATTNEQCLFEFKGLAIGYPYHLLFEKEGFAARQIAIKMERKKEFQSFFLSPLTKFTQGYDLLLGERDPNKSVLFGTIYKGGKPLERAIVKAPQSEKIVYERSSDLGSFPDETLFSASSEGKFILWNVDPGKVSLDLFYDGHHLGRRSVKLMPGIAHQMEIHLD